MDTEHPHPYAVFQDWNRHTVIRVAVGHKWTKFIPMQAGALEVQKLPNTEFAAIYFPLAYDLKPAAEKFLHRPELQSVQQQAKEHLLRILRDDLSSPQPLEESEVNDMATAPAKKAAAKRGAAPAKTTKPAAKKAAEAPSAPSAPAKKAKAAAPSDAKYRVADTSKVKRGFLAEFVEAANKLGEFTRDKLTAKFAERQDVGSDRAVRYFHYCTGNGIFAAIPS